MYITINDVIGEKTIDLSYPIYPEKEIAVVSMFSNNSQVLFQKSMEVLLYTGKKIVLNKGVYTDKELDSLIGTELKSQMLDSRDDVLRTNKFKKITKVAISLNELDNSDNLEDGRPSNTLFTYYVTYYITINNIKGESRIDLSYSIHSDKEIAVIRMFSTSY